MKDERVIVQPAPEAPVVSRVSWPATLAGVSARMDVLAIFTADGQAPVLHA